MTKQISSKEQFVSNFILNEEYKVAIENDTYHLSNTDLANRWCKYNFSYRDLILTFFSTDLGVTGL